MSSRTSEFAIIKFQHSQILLLHRESHTVYEYCECASTAFPDTRQCPYGLMQPITYGQGVLFPKVKSTLQAELEGRRRAHIVLPFEEQEVRNTFEPIIKCLLALHDLDLVFGSLCPSNIVITEREEVKLREKRINPKENGYYLHKNLTDIKKEDDWMALGEIMLQTATLKKSSKLSGDKQLPAIIEALMDRFTKGFIFALCILLKRNKEKIPQILSYLKNEERSLADAELNALYNSVKADRERRRAPTVTNQNICQNVPINKPVSFSAHESSLRKVMAVSFGNTLRKISKEDSQNKKTPGQQRARKTDRINKIIEKSNEFAIDMLAKKNKEALTKIAPKPNIANISLFSSELFRKKTKDTPTVAPSPSKNIRSISRKK